MRAPVWLPAGIVVAYGLCPFAGFLEDNHSETSLGAVLPYALAVVAPFVVVVLVVQVARGTAGALRCAAAFAAVLFVTLNFSTFAKVADALPGSNYLSQEVLVWLVVTLGAGLLAVRLVIRGRTPATWFFAIGAAIAVIPIAQYAVFRAGTASPAVANSAAAGVSGPRSGGPNVYYFMVDAYARADVLKRTFGFDNSRFLASLRKRGFVVPAHARSDYPVTFESLPSTFAMDYPVGRDGPERTTLDDMMRIVQQSNPTVAAFHTDGYHYVEVQAENWVTASCAGLEDLCLSADRGGGPIKLSRIQWGLLKMSPAARLVEELAPGAVATGTVTPARVVQKLYASKPPEPFFLFSHILMTHPPYSIRGKNCTRVHDAHVRDLRIVGDQWKHAYKQSVNCANISLDAAVDQIVKKDPRAIIVIQADHGSDVGLTWDKPQSTWPTADIRDRFKIFDALRLPARCRDMVSDDTVVVNTFRIVLACIEGRQPRLLKPRFFITDYRRGEVRPYKDWEGEKENRAGEI